MVKEGTRVGNQPGEERQWTHRRQQPVGVPALRGRTNRSESQGSEADESKSKGTLGKRDKTKQAKSCANSGKVTFEDGGITSNWPTGGGR